MFNKKIRETPLVRGIANEFFKIYGDSFNDDRSFLATLRALLHRRSNGADVNLSIRSFNSFGYRGHTFTNPAGVFTRISPVPYGANVLSIRYLMGSTDDNAAILSLYDNTESGFTKTFPNYHEAKDLQVFVQKRGKLNARFYINEHDKETLIVCEGLTLCSLHLLQSLTPRLFPWFFSEIPLDEVESSLLDALTFRNATEYERILSLLADRIDFREHMIKNVIGDFDKIGRREELEKTKNERDNYRQELDNLTRRYQEYLTAIDNLNIRLIGQEMALEAASDGSELIDYFICNRSLTPVRVRGRQLEFTVKTFFEFFDPEQYRTYIRNKNSFLYTGYDYLREFNDLEVRRKMLDAIFADEPILRVKMCANYIIDLRGQGSAHDFYTYGDDFIDYIPNPHIHHFACLGSYHPHINRMIQEGNLIGAIEQCMASAKSLNFSESHTVRYFLNDVFTSTHRIIRLPDGRDVTPVEALEYLNSLDAKKEEENV